MPRIILTAKSGRLLQQRSAVLICGAFALFAVLGVPLAHADQTVRCQLADGFDYPVGKPDSAGYHKARGFYPNGHLGEDWNGNGGGDSDLGDPIYSTARGVVVFAENVRVGWGNMIIIRHIYRESDGRVAVVDSLYGHLLENLVKVGAKVERGQLIGKMGGNNGMYPVHLHFEIHKNLTMGPNRSGFAHDYSNYYSPTPFINAHRSCESDSKKYDIPLDTFAPHGQQLTAAQIQRAQSLTLPVIASSKPIPKTTIGALKDPPKTPPAETAKPGTTPAEKPEEKEKGDFWSRLRSKLGKGTPTSGIEEKK